MLARDSQLWRNNRTGLNPEDSPTTCWHFCTSVNASGVA